MFVTLKVEKGGRDTAKLCLCKVYQHFARAGPRDFIVTAASASHSIIVSVNFYRNI